MTLMEGSELLATFDDDATIYAVEPWSRDSEAAVALESPEGGLSSIAANRGMRYFLEVFIAKELLNGLEKNSARSAEDRCERLIQYARNDS